MMLKIKEEIANLINQMTDKVSYAAIGGGAGLGFYGRISSEEYFSSLFPVSLTDWVAVFSIILTIVLIIKNIKEILSSKEKSKK